MNDDRDISIDPDSTEWIRCVKIAGQIWNHPAMIVLPVDTVAAYRIAGILFESRAAWRKSLLPWFDKPAP